MGLFSNSEREHIIERLLEIIEIQAEALRNCCQKKPNQVKLVLINKITNQRIMSLSLATNQKSIGVLGLVDSTNPATIVTGTFSGTTAVSDNPAVATTLVNADGSVSVIAVAVGTCNVTVASTAAFTDSTGTAQSDSETSDPIGVTVTAIVVADSVKLVVNFGPPIAQ